MLDYKILKNKGKLYKKNSNGTTEEFLDLLTKSCNSMDSTAGDIIIVNKYYIARPDLISLAVYGSDEYADLICKYNGISNPFELNENDVIVLPQYHEFQNLIDTVNNTTSELVNDDVSDNTNYSSNKKKSDRRSPAQTTTGDKNFIIDRSSILLKLNCKLYLWRFKE